MESNDYVVAGAGTAGCVFANCFAGHAMILPAAAGACGHEREIPIQLHLLFPYRTHHAVRSMATVQ